jgi:hypothetical protein
MSDSPDDELVIQLVSTRKQLKEFISLPQKIYSDDPNWVTPLWFEQLHRFTDKNPFFQHATWQAWIAYRGSRPVGRISAQIDDLYTKAHSDEAGFFGLIEADDDPELFALLLDTAEKWLQERGMKQIRGPFNLSINEECGLLVEGFEKPPFAMMGHARKYYGDRIEAQGYGKAKDLFAYEMDPDFKTPRVMQRLLDRLGDEVVVRGFQRKHLQDELETLRDIFNDSWSNNWGFTPFTEEEFADIGELLTLLIDDDFIQIAEIDGEPAAMVVAIPDINQATIGLRGRLLPLGWLKLLWRLKVRFPDRARVMLMGVRKQYQQSRQGSALAFLVIDKVRQALVRRKVTNIELSWILEDNDGMRAIARAIGGNPYKRYRIYEKLL